MKRAASTRTTVLILALLTSACAGGAQQAQAPLPTGYVAPRAAASTPRPVKRADQCGAQDLAWLVGKPKTEIPVPVSLANRRVLCTTCPRTDDLVPGRLNILFDPETQTVVQLTCG